MRKINLFRFRFVSITPFSFCARTVPMIFFSSVVYAMVCFFLLAKKWPALMIEWDKIENGLPKLRSQFDKQKLANQVKMVTIIMMMMSLCKWQSATTQIATISYPTLSLGSWTHIEHNFDCSLFKSMSAQGQGSDQRIFLGPIESVFRVFHQLRTVESISGQMFECDLHICMDIHGRFRDGDEYRTVQSF